MPIEVKTSQWLCKNFNQTCKIANQFLLDKSRNLGHVNMIVTSDVNKIIFKTKALLSVIEAPQEQHRGLEVNIADCMFNFCHPFMTLKPRPHQQQCRSNIVECSSRTTLSKKSNVASTLLNKSCFCIVLIIQFHIKWKYSKFIFDLFLVRLTNRFYQRQRITSRRTACMWSLTTCFV